MIDLLFSEEAGLVLEVLPQNEERVTAAFAAAQVGRAPALTLNLDLRPCGLLGVVLHVFQILQIPP